MPPSNRCARRRQLILIKITEKASNWICAPMEETYDSTLTFLFVRRSPIFPPADSKKRNEHEKEQKQNKSQQQRRPSGIDCLLNRRGATILTDEGGFCDRRSLARWAIKLTARKAADIDLKTFLVSRFQTSPLFMSIINIFNANQI